MPGGFQDGSWEDSRVTSVKSGYFTERSIFPVLCWFDDELDFVVVLKCVCQTCLFVFHGIQFVHD